MRLPLYMLISATVSALALTGCSTAMKNSFQKVTVSTPGVENVQCLLTTEFNKYIVLTTRQVVVERSKKPMTVTCEKAGFYSTAVTVESKVRMAPSQLNAFYGFVPGTVYDVMTDSIYDYPETIVVTMVPKADMYPPPAEQPYMLMKKPEEIKPVPVVISAEEPAQADESLSKSLRK